MSEFFMMITLVTVARPWVAVLSFRLAGPAANQGASARSPSPYCRDCRESQIGYAVLQNLGRVHR